VRVYINVATPYDKRRPLLRQSTILLAWDTRRVLRVAVEIIYEKQFLNEIKFITGRYFITSGNG